MAAIILVAVLVVGLLMLPFGLPGLWVMVGAALIYSYMEPQHLGVPTLVVITVLALVAEILEFLASGSYARKYGGSRRAGWGAIIGGLVGAIIGVPIPLIGSVIGAFAGAFAGAFLAELTVGSRMKAATRVATGALVGRLVATALKVAIGLALLVWVIVALIVGR